MGIRKRLDKLMKKTDKLRGKVSELDTSIISSHLYSNLRKSFKKVDDTIKKAAANKIRFDDSPSANNGNIADPAIPTSVGNIDDGFASHVSLMFQERIGAANFYKNESESLRAIAVSSINRYRDIALGDVSNGVSEELSHKQVVLRSLYTAKSILERMLRGASGDRERESFIIAKIQELNSEIQEVQQEIETLSSQNGIDVVEVEKAVVLGEIFRNIISSESLEFESIRLGQIALSEILNSYPLYCAEVKNSINESTERILSTVYSVAMTNSHNIREVHSFISRRMDELNGLITGYGRTGRTDILKMNQTLEASQGELLISLKSTQDKLVSLSAEQMDIETEMLGVLIQAEDDRVKKEKEREAEEGGFLGALGSNPILAPFMWLLKNIPKFLVFFAIGALVLLPVFLWLIDIAMEKLQTIITRSVVYLRNSILSGLEKIGRILDPELKLLKDGELEESRDEMDKPIESKTAEKGFAGLLEKGKDLYGPVVSNIKGFVSEKVSQAKEYFAGDVEAPQGEQKVEAAEQKDEPSGDKKTETKADGEKKSGATGGLLDEAKKGVMGALTSMFGSKKTPETKEEDTKPGTSAEGEETEKEGTDKSQTIYYVSDIKNISNVDMETFLKSTEKTLREDTIRSLVKESVFNRLSEKEKNVISFYKLNEMTEALNHTLKIINDRYSSEKGDSTASIETQVVEVGDVVKVVQQPSTAEVIEQRGERADVKETLSSTVIPNTTVGQGDVSFSTSVQQVVPRSVSNKQEDTEIEEEEGEVEEESGDGRPIVHIIDGGQDNVYIEKTSIVNVGNKKNYNGSNIDCII